MSCDCRKRIESKLAALAVDRAPKEADHKVDLQGYAIVLGAQASMRPFMDALVTTTTTSKTGAVRTKKKHMNMFFSFCPFCGVAIETKE
jgi:hypothetical protein